MEVKRKRQWVKIGFVKQVTGWNKEEMRRARAQGVIKFTKSSVDGFKYDLNSIPDIFIINKKALTGATVNA